jgi:exodeoxyribonuclease V alpha subunit
MGMLDQLATLRRAGALGDLDLHFARLIARVGGGDGPVALAAALVSQWTGRGHICLDLASATDIGHAAVGEVVEAPAIDAWVETLRNSPAVGRPGDFAPLVLDEAGRLYLYRYWAYEREVAVAIQRRLMDDPSEVDLARLRAGLDRLFPPSTDGAVDWQRMAAATAVLKRFAVITGGPGTGKTTTVVRILALLLEQTASRPARIALAAPTGKAAARMQDAIRRTREALPVEAAVRDSLPAEASTIHRLLGARPGSVDVKYDRDTPLPVDVLVVDEASMVDLALMAKLIQALPPEARLILVGDRDQLASVEAGAVLGDICGDAPGFSSAFRRRLVQVTGADPGGEGDGPPIRDAVVLLQQSYRFGEQSGIGQVARMVKRGEGRRAFEVLTSGDAPDVAWRTIKTPRDLRQALVPATMGFREAALAENPGDALAALDQFRVLCAHRSGPWGMETVNTFIEERLAADRLLVPRGVWYRGRPILVTSNDYHLRLFNGDVGIVWPDPDAGGPLRVYIRGTDGALRRFAPARLPAHETAYAATVHKSQGSEVERVLLILPGEMSPVLTRELIYTAITRARSRVEICGAYDVFEAAVGRRLTRSSGLRDALWADRPMTNIQ